MGSRGLTPASSLRAQVPGPEHGGLHFQVLATLTLVTGPECLVSSTKFGGLGL